MSAIRDHMTEHPHTIGGDQTIAEASRRMREHHVRHLPVLEGGQLIGLVSDRDIALAESVGHAERTVKVADVMSSEAFSVGPDADLGEVVARMADQKVGSAVVMQGTKVVGIFTTTDALRMLSRALVVEDVRDRLFQGGGR